MCQPFGECTQPTDGHFSLLRFFYPFVPQRLSGSVCCVLLLSDVHVTICFFYCCRPVVSNGTLLQGERIFIMRQHVRKIASDDKETEARRHRRHSSPAVISKLRRIANESSRNNRFTRKWRILSAASAAVTPKPAWMFCQFPLFRPNAVYVGERSTEKLLRQAIARRLFTVQCDRYFSIGIIYLLVATFDNAVEGGISDHVGRGR